METPKVIINIGSGKMPIKTDMAERYFIVNLDSMYIDGIDQRKVESQYKDWEENSDPLSNRQVVYCNEDVFTFLEHSTIKFDEVYIHRYLEHIEFTSIEYFIYLVSTITVSDAYIDVIVPDAKILANMLLNEKVDDSDFHANDIIITTEFVNDPSDPHASVWTVDRAKHFWTLEKRFTVNSCAEKYIYDGRDIYLRMILTRV